MKIGIVTIYRCYNYGSFYQAYGLFEYIKSLGHDVSFLPVDCKYNISYRLHKQFNRDIKRDLFNLKLSASYLKDWKLYSIAGKNENDFDLIIIGSDEIWNINNKTFLPDPRYYGVDLPVEKVFTYASCVGRSCVSDFKDYPSLINGIKNIKTVSARDDATEKFVKELKGTVPPRVIDPSFLADWRKIEKKTVEKNYILVYTYDGYWGFSDEYIKATKEFAKSKNLPLVSVGFRNDWCDKWVAASPREFLGYLRNASYVVTDTFHGTAMSIQYEKQFVSMGKGKSKVESLLNDFGLSDRIFTADNGFSQITGNSIDYSTVNMLINEKISYSKKFIDSNL